MIPELLFACEQNFGSAQRDEVVLRLAPHRVEHVLHRHWHSTDFPNPQAELVATIKTASWQRTYIPK